MGDIVPDQVTPASDATSLSDGTATGGIKTNASNIPIVNGDAINGKSAFYARHDHVHPQQLTYDGNVTVTKFIKTEGLAIEIICASGDTTTLDRKFSKTYSGNEWVILCIFPSGNSASSPFIEFKVYSSNNAVQIIRLQPNYTVNGITAMQGLFSAPTEFSSYYGIENGANQLFHTHTGTGPSAVQILFAQGSRIA
ncbi:MAG: hypothetical protein EZS28_000907 [Streblomastix strix]|uniref:Uncharacterized protein n=1 Tax=Streblomastix strix TaxID=222440 RepID=A0A5J4X8J8_9EUKA|nr:MAG: hypothetical protein EZS28_000907 [Streblomastix strix]